MTRFQKILLALVGGLLVVVAVGAGILISQNVAQQQREDFLRCMAINGVTPEDPGTLDEAIAANEACSD